MSEEEVRRSRAAGGARGGQCRRRLLRAGQRCVTGWYGDGAAKGAGAEVTVAAGRSSGSSRSCTLRVGSVADSA
jgi:hypothetical protein